MQEVLSCTEEKLTALLPKNISLSKDLLFDGEGVLWGLAF
jgi:hypothetical protein